MTDSADRSYAVSVVVPTYNRARVLGVCLDSLLAQELDDSYEIVVVDDGSSDATASVVDAVRSAYDGPVPLRYERQEHAGISVARNRGAILARSQLIAYIDDDDDVPPSWLGVIVDGARRHPEADALGGAVCLRVEGREPRHCRGDRLPASQLDHGPHPVWDQMLYGGNLAVRRAALERVGPFRPGMSPGEEEDWERRLLAAGGHTLYLPEAWLWHRRTQQDLGRWHLVRRSYRNGYHHVPYLLSAGVRSTPTRELVMAIRGIGHAVVFGCFYGTLRASRAWGVRRGLLVVRRAGGS